MKLDLQPPWFDEASCRGKGHDQFFGDGAAPDLCRDCPVRVECLEWCYAGPAIAWLDGIYGGTFPVERRDPHRARAIAARGRPEWSNAPQPPPPRRRNVQSGMGRPPRHGGTVLYDQGCRCDLCVRGQEQRLSRHAQATRVYRRRLRSVS